MPQKILIFLLLIIGNLVHAQKQEPRLVLPVGHYDKLTDVSFNKDGTLALTASWDNTARIYEVSSGKELHVLSGHKSYLSSAEFSPDSKLVLTVSRDKTARIFDVDSGMELQLFSGYKENINSAMFSLDSKFLMISSDKNHVEIFQVSTGKLISVLKGNKNYVRNAVFSPDSKLAITFGESLRLYEVASGKQISILKGHNKIINSAVFSPDGKFILTASNDFSSRIYEVESGQLLNVIWHSAEVKSVSYSPDGKKIVAALANKNSYVFDAISGKELQVFQEENLNNGNNYVRSAIFNCLGSLILTRCSDDSVRIYNVETGLKSYTFLGGQAQFSQDGKMVIVSGPEKTARIYKLDSANEFKQLNGCGQQISTTSFTLKENYIKMNSGDILTKYFNTYTGKLLDSIQFKELDSSTNINLHQLNIGIKRKEGNSKVAVIYDLESQQIFKILKAHFGYITRTIMSYDGSLAITTSWDKTARIYEIETGRTQLLRGHKDWVLNANFSPNLKQVVTASRDKTARIYNVETGEEVQCLRGNTDFVYSALFSPDGKLVLTTSRDMIARVFEVSTGKELYVLKGHKNKIKTAIFSPDQKFILTQAEDYRMILWDVATGKPLYTRLQLEGDDWLVYDTNYRFDGTPSAIEKLYFVCGLEVVELNQVKDSLYVPNLVQRIMNGENLDRLPKLSDLNICGVTPIVEPIDKGDGGYHYEITPRTGGVGDIEIYLNGVVRQTENAKRLKLKNGKYSIQVDPKLIERYQIPGEALQVKVIAKTANNSISSRGVVLDLESDEPTTLRKPSLHAVMIGVDDYKDDNLDLNYAAKDANDLHVALEQASKKFFNVDDTNRVFFYNLTRNREGKIGTDKIKGKTPDKANIILTLEEIEKNSKPEDILLVFFAGHGEIVDKDQLLLLTTEATSTNFEGIRMRELLEQLNKIPAGKRVLILDACHSGAAINNLDYAQLTGKRDVKDAERQSQRLKELDKLASKSGFAIITASSSDQKALELPQYEHGLMTYALLNAMLNNKSSLDENNQLQLDKWLIATEEEVKKLNQNQSAERMVPVTFTLGKIDEEVRSSIVLKEIPTVFVENVLNKNTFNDNLKIKYMLSSAFQEMSRGTDTQIMVADFPNAVKVNILYEEKGDELKANISLYKENFEQKFELTGKKVNISEFVQDLMNQIRTKIQK